MRQIIEDFNEFAAIKDKRKRTEAIMSNNEIFCLTLWIDMMKDIRNILTNCYDSDDDVYAILFNQNIEDDRKS